MASSAHQPHPAQPASLYDDQARTSTHTNLTTHPEHEPHTLEGLGRPSDRAHADAPPRAHSRGRSEANFGRPTSPPSGQASGEAGWETEARVMREQRAERARGHRQSSS